MPVLWCESVGHRVNLNYNKLQLYSLRNICAEFDFLLQT